MEKSIVQQTDLFMPTCPKCKEWFVRDLEIAIFKTRKGFRRRKRVISDEPHCPNDCENLGQILCDTKNENTEGGCRE